MSQFTITFPGGAEALITNCIVMPATDFSKGEKVTSYYPTDNAVWDTGADTTIIRKSVAEALGLIPLVKSAISGIGGVVSSNVYSIHLGLPSGEAVLELEAMELPDEQMEYDVIIGMDVIRECDFAITNKDANTKFTYDRPSKRDLDFTKE